MENEPPKKVFNPSKERREKKVKVLVCGPDKTLGHGGQDYGYGFMLVRYTWVASQDSATKSQTFPTKN